MDRRLEYNVFTEGVLEILCPFFNVQHNIVRELILQRNSILKFDIYSSDKRATSMTINSYKCKVV